MHTTALFLFLTLGLVFSSSAQTTWTFDKAHTTIGFEVTHLVITTVDGKFKSFEGNVTTKGDSFEDAKVDFTVDVASITTDNDKRDTHLRSDDFFNAEKYPKMTFKSVSMKNVSGKKYKLVGDLTIRDKTRRVELDAVLNGTVKDPWGNTKAGFRLTGEINRFDYDLKWNTLMEAGGAVVSKDVQFNINVQLQKKS
ncbi:MAG: YceI family protein [Bacteroidetes bacterium]|nr:YceI family protein [Bacteroidota bacterium]